MATLDYTLHLTPDPNGKKSPATGRFQEDAPPLLQREARLDSATDAVALPPQVPSDALTGAAVAVALLRYPGGAPDTDEAITRLTTENRALLDDAAGGGAILQALASQLAVLESVFLRYVLNAEQADTPEQAVPLMKLALAAQAAWVRAVSVLVMAKGGARVLP